MKYKKGIFLTAAFVAGIVLLFQIQTVFRPIKEEINFLLKEAVDTDLFERMQEAGINPRTNFTPSLENVRTRLQIISEHKNVWIPYNTINKMESEILDEKRIHQTVMSLSNPIDIGRLDSTFHSKLQIRSLRALKTSLCLVNDKAELYTPGSNKFLFFRSDTIYLDVEKKLKVQVSLIPSPAWIILRTPFPAKFTGIIFIILFLLNVWVVFRSKPVAARKLLTYRKIKMLPPHVTAWYKQPTQKAIMPVCHLSTEISKMENGYYCIGNIVFDSNHKILINYKGERKNISKRKECDLLKAFLEAPEYTLEHSEVRSVLQLTSYSNESVRTTIFRLRQYIRSGTVSISAIRSQGYKLTTASNKKYTHKDKSNKRSEK